MSFIQTFKVCASRRGGDRAASAAFSLRRGVGQDSRPAAGERERERERGKVTYYACMHIAPACVHACTHACISCMHLAVGPSAIICLLSSCKDGISHWVLSGMFFCFNLDFVAFAPFVWGWSHVFLFGTKWFVCRSGLSIDAWQCPNDIVFFKKVVPYFVGFFYDDVHCWRCLAHRTGLSTGTP